MSRVAEMSEKSRYLKYLPAILWENDSLTLQFSLGAMLNIFEKILTGIDDDVTIGAGDQQYKPIQSIIDKTAWLYHPIGTQSADWLASWVALQLPKTIAFKNGKIETPPVWDEYQ